MEASNPILDNPLFIVAVILFLIFIPLFLRQKRKSALDMVLDQYEKEETKAAAKEAAEIDSQQEKSSIPDARPATEVKKDKGSIPTFGKEKAADPEGVPAFGESVGGIPPLLEDKGSIPFPDGTLKVVKEGVPISHSDTPDSPSATRKKKKFTSEAVPVSHNEEMVPSKETSSSDPKKKDSPVKVKGKKWVEDFYASPKKESDVKESGHNWIEADIPGLIIEPLPEAKVSSREKPVKKSAKEEEKSKAKKKVKELKKSPAEEKGVAKVKNLDARAEEEKTAPTEKPDKNKTKTPDSRAKAVENEAIVVSHKDSAEKPAEPVSPHKAEAKATPGQKRPKPFFLDLKYLIEEGKGLAGPDGLKKLSSEMVDRIVARLSQLQVNLENQLTTRVPTVLDKSHEDMRQERIQDSPPGRENPPEELSDKKEVSLEELDSFLFTTSQRKDN